MRVSPASRNTVSSPDLPAAFDGTRIVYLADIHAGPDFSAARVGRVIDRVMALKPDLIVLGGDYVGGGTNGATMFYNLYLYLSGWQFHEMGYAAALAVVMFIIVLILTIILFQSQRRWVYYAGGD